MFEKLVMDIVGATCSVMRLIQRFSQFIKVWNMVQKIKGKNNKTNVHHLKDGHDTLTSEQEISNKLGQIFSQNFSTQNYDPEASLHSSLNHGFPGCFGFVEVFGIVSSAIDITVSLNFKIGSVEFLIINHR
jgi:hypothetical protein